MAHRLLRKGPVRGAAFALLLAGCIRPPVDAGPPPTFPTLEPDRPVDPNPIGLADLQSIAGAASIALEIGPAPVLHTHSCEAAAAAAYAPDGPRCYACTLAVFDAEPSQTLQPVEASLRTLASTLLAYPHSFLRVARIERIALCRQLIDEGDRDSSEHVAGLAEGIGRRLMVNLDQRDLAHPDATLHHEIFHLFDQATAPDGDHMHDPAWERINPHSFHYGDAASAAIQAGFVNDYAKTNPAEDKASVFEYLMGYPDELCARAADDPLLLAKVRLLLARIDAVIPPGLVEFATRRAPCLAPRRAALRAAGS